MQNCIIISLLRNYTRLDIAVSYDNITWNQECHSDKWNYESCPLFLTYTYLSEYKYNKHTHS